MTSSQIIALASPVFLLLIGLEWWIGKRRGRPTYRLNDAFNSLSLGMLSQVLGLFSALLAVGIYTAVWRHASLWHWPTDQVWTWGLALLLYDFCYYWLHRCGHTVAVLWAAHAVHHQSEDYNLTTALRQTSSGHLLGWLFYLPLAVLGVPPLVFATVGLIDLLYQFWVHTQHVGRLGWFDRWFCSPSNHRVHHAVNDRYLDKNYGGILMVWDKLFGTYIEEDDAEPIVYGTRKPLRSWNPVWANAEVYATLAKDSWRTRHLRDKLKVWLMPPGWRPSDVAAQDPSPAFALDRPLYNPPLSRQRQALAWALGLLALGGVLSLLWVAHTLSWSDKGLAALAVLGLLWLIGRVCTPPNAQA
ncbi:MAG: fatty acid hydroxylase [Ideonella sp. MAG2]|nr:MAG: fatty acid hydroxylase [Ideonella sp. MAG2]